MGTSTNQTPTTEEGNLMDELDEAERQAENDRIVETTVETARENTNDEQ